MNNSIDFKELIDDLNVGIYRRMCGIKGKFLYVNDAFRNMIGYSLDEINHLCVEDIYADLGKVKALDKKVRDKGFIQRLEIPLRRKDKKIIWCSVSSTAVKDDSGKVKWVDVVVEDITVQKQVEKELIESKELFRVVFQNSAAAITVTDKNERIIAWNPFAEQILEMTKEDLFNKPVKDLYSPEEWRRIRSLNIRKKGMRSDLEAQVLKKDGTPLDVSTSISVLKDADGNVTGSIGIMSDISNQKKTVKQLKDSEEKFRAILDNSPAAIMLTNANEQIVSWNTFTEVILGMTEKELYLKKVSSLYPEKEWRKIRAANIRKTGSKQHMETKVLKKDGSTLDVDLSVNILMDASGKIVGSVGVLQDVTEQNRIKKMLIQAKLAAEEASSSKSLFLANMSHELRTPMNTIMGMIDLTIDTPLDEEQKDNLVVAKDAAENLLNLINDILDLSRVEAGKITLESIEFHLSNVIKNVCKGLSVLAQKKELNLLWNMDDKIPELLEGDPGRLRQILINLINNAIKFTHKGSITVDVALEKDLPNDECCVRFSVKDEGIGIPEDKVETVFETFSQADDSHNRRYGGTGLGLAICKKLVEMKGGRVWAESEVGKGSTFIFTAVYKKSKNKKKEEAASTVEAAGQKSGESVVKDLRILLAEDNLVNQKMTVRLLEKRGWTVKAADNGQIVLDILNKEDFDLILMDAQMPVLDGLEATKIIRDEEKQTGKHIPIIALTAAAMEEDKKRCYAAGMDEYTTKPINMKKLYETIETIVIKGCKNE